MKEVLLAVDPGVKTAGVAVFYGMNLEVAWLVQAHNWHDTATSLWNEVWVHAGTRQPDRVVVEVPQIYVGAKQKGRQKDLIDLAVVAGMILGVFSDAEKLETIQPAEWKGQVPKEIVHRRTKEKLSPSEKKNVEQATAKSKMHNVWDAVSLGLYVLGR